MDCAGVAVEAQQVVVEEVITTEETIEEVAPVALYIILDQSSSMNAGGLWVPATDAIRRFVTDPASEGIDVALELFPPDFLEVGDCTGAGYDMPLVTLGRLPDHSVNVTQMLDQRPLAAGIGTPIEGGLRGGIRFCQQFESDHPDEACVVVLITDGAPSGCLQDADSLSTIARDAYAGGTGVRTFAVGLLGADFTLLDRIASEGGAVDCVDGDDTRFSCDVSAGPEQLADALTRIREVTTTVQTHTEVVTRVEETPLECEWDLPAAPPGETLDPDKINVVLTGSSLAETTLGRVPDVTVCAAMGWHYDDAHAPTRIVACPATCTAIQTTASARVDIQVGCETVPLF